MIQLMGCWGLQALAPDYGILTNFYKALEKAQDSNGAKKEQNLPYFESYFVILRSEKREVLWKNLPALPRLKSLPFYSENNSREYYSNSSAKNH